MSQQIGWSVEAKLLYQIKQLAKSIGSRSYIQTYANFASFPNPGITGTLYVDEATGDIYVWNGTSYVLLSSGITALNGLIAAAQLFSTGTSGTDFNISSVGTTHTFNIPTASASNRGLLSSADWTTFNNKPSGTGTTNYVSKFTGASTLGNSQIFDNGTNVGIGTSSPTVKLDVAGQGRFVSTITDPLRIQSTNTSGGFVAIQNSTIAPLLVGFGGTLAATATVDEGVIRFATSQALHIAEGSTTRALFQGGKLLLNTTIDAGAYALQVSGNAYTSGNIISNSRISALTEYRLSDNEFTRVAIIDNGGAFAGGYNLTLSGDTPVHAATGAVSGYYYSPNGPIFYSGTSASASTTAPERMRITSTGNIGIGTTTPAHKLEIANSGAATLSLRDTTQATDEKTWLIQNDIAAGAGTLRIRANNDANTNGQNAIIITKIGFAIQTHQYFTSNAERMRIFANGNVRIASSFTDSGQLLQLGGNMHISNGSYIGDQTFTASRITFNNTVTLTANSGVNIETNGANICVSFTSAYNFGLRQSTFGTSATHTLAISTGTAPGSSPADCFQLYSADITAGNAAPHFRTENGAVVKVYQETTAVAAAALVGGGGTTITDTDTFDGYTLQQIVKALRNQGLLA